VTDSAFCSDCTNEDGSLKNYDDIVNILTTYFIETQGFDREAARSAAIGVMSRQPAWEAKIGHDSKKSMIRTRFILASTAIVFALTGAGFAWIIALKRPGINYYNTSSKTSSPFSNIAINKLNDLEINELKCSSDQKLVSIDGNYVTFKNLTGGLNSPTYDHFIYHIYQQEGSKVDANSTYFNTIMANGNAGLLINERFNGITRVWRYNSGNQQMVMLPGQFVERSKKHVLTANDKGLDVYRIDTGKLVLHADTDGYKCESALSDEYLLFHDNKNNSFKLNMFDGKKYEFLDKGAPTNAYANNRYGFVLYLDDSFRDSLYCFDSQTGKSHHMTTTNITRLEISQANSPEDTVVAWGYSERNPQRNEVYKRGIRIIRMNEPDKIVDLFTSENSDLWMIPLAVTSQYMLWDERNIWRANENNQWVNGTIKSYGLRFFDFFDGRQIKLEDSNCDKVMVDGWNVAWEVYRGENNDEYFNIKCANLEQTNNNYNDIAIPQTAGEVFSNIQSEKVGKYEVQEIRAKYDQFISPKAFGESNLTANDNLAIIYSQGNDKNFLFSPKLELAATYDASSPNLRQILGEKKLCISRYDNSYDQFDDFKRLESRTFDPTSDKFTDEFLEKETNKGISTIKENGYFNLYFNLPNGSKKMVHSSQNHFKCSFVTKNAYREWLVYVTIDGENKESVHVYEIASNKDSIVEVCENIEYLTIFACGNFIFYKNATSAYQTVCNLETGLKNQIKLEDLTEYLTALSLFDTENPLLLYRKSNYKMLVGKAKSLLQNGIEGLMQIDVTPEETVKFAIGNKLIIAKRIKVDPKPNTRKLINENYSELSVLDMETVEKTMLCKSESIKDIWFAGDYLFWTINRGRVNLEFQNICYTKIK
jgi:hypothetical protein